MRPRTAFSLVTTSAPMFFTRNQSAALLMLASGSIVATSVIQNRRVFLGAVFSALPALALFDPGTATAQEVVKQIKLTDKHIQNFMAAYEDIAKLYDGAESDKPEDPQVEAQAAAVAKKNGFAGLAQYDDVLTNITM